ncbi:MAG: hypothetical protein KAT65_07925, partial [Methanophagales archaeon]|nr:hypothetical protein [Methanophagales archaeon]
IYDNHAKRTFEEASINTIIVIFKRPEGKHLADNLTRFVAFKKPFEVVIDEDNLKAIADAREKLKTDDFRYVPLTQGELWNEGITEEDTKQAEITGSEFIGKYKGNKWGGKYLRAPDIFFTILEKGKDKLVRLEDIAEVRFGIKTGANEFFYLPSKYFDVKEEGDYYRLIPKQEELPADIRIEKEFLQPIVSDFESLKKIKIKPNKFIFTYPEEDCEKNDYEANRYIKFGCTLKTKGRQKQASGIPLPEIESFQGRKYWYAISFSNDMYSNIFWEKRVGERFSTFFSDSNILADQKFYPVKLKEQSSQLPFLTSVNSTIERLFLEIDAVSYTGAYTLIEMSVNNAKNLKLINPTLLHQLKLDIQNKQFKSIFEECG